MTISPNQIINGRIQSNENSKILLLEVRFSKVLKINSQIQETVRAQKLNGNFDIIEKEESYNENKLFKQYQVPCILMCKNDACFLKAYFS